MFWYIKNYFLKCIDINKNFLKIGINIEKKIFVCLFVCLKWCICLLGDIQ